MSPDQIRETYLAFFEARGHTRHPSDSLVPENDPTLLFTGAGMNQFKAEFMGKGNLPFTRAVTSQKCMRMPDLENVGRTASHHTFFEMLGNFSFGDYFKAEAIPWAWALLMDWGVPPERLSVTVYEDDDEAADIWADVVGVPRERIFRYGEEENFWPASAPSKGPNGICGPCSEIYFDFHPERGAIPAAGPAEDGERFVEIWNLVFTQFERLDGGRLEPLPKKNIDTGMGFERMVRVLESLERGTVLASNFETALFAGALAAIHEHVGRTTEHGTPDGARVRRIADHVRAATFGIGDGVRPSNERQGYVIRKVLRRAMIDRHTLGGDLRTPWLCELAGVFVDEMGDAYPELREARGVVTSTIAGEEERFAEVLLSGGQRLSALAESARQAGRTVLPGEDAFLLYDTFGLPLDLQRLLLERERMDVDEAGFREAMAAQRRRSQEGSKISASIFDEGPLAAVGTSLPETVFVRDALAVEDATLLAVVDVDEGDRVVLVLDRSPFYPEGGGQVGDTGVVSGDGFEVQVEDTQAVRGITLHQGVIVRGRPVTGPARAAVDARTRAATARHHTGTHLLHAALRRVLGEECTQAGSLVAPDRLRFDFRFPRAPTRAEVETVEDLVNGWILENEGVRADEMPRDEAREQGAVALFGEKYGDVVRVVRVAGGSVGSDSVELCGGTHVTRSGDIGLFKILSEGSIAAGIRRLEAQCGLALVETMRAREGVLGRIGKLLRAQPDELEARVEATVSDAKVLRKRVEELQARLTEGALAAGRRAWHGRTVLLAVLEQAPAKAVRERLLAATKEDVDVALVASRDGERATYFAAASRRAQGEGLGADALCRALGEALDGRGGGKPAFAQGQGRCAEPLEEVLERVLESAVATPS